MPTNDEAQQDAARLNILEILVRAGHDPEFRPSWQDGFHIALRVDNGAWGHFETMRDALDELRKRNVMH